MQNLLTWVMNHQAMMGGSVVALLDLIFAMSSKLESNGILHFIYVQAKNLTTK